MQRRARLAFGAVVLTTVAVASLAATSAATRSPRNPFGVTIVRFAKGTTPAQMQAAVSDAGGQVVDDLYGASAVAVLPTAADFSGKIRAEAGVLGAFGDKPIGDLPQPDRGSGSGSAGSEPKAAKSASPPDPWHDAGSFLGETNPEGILQWDDARMNVPSAWSRTRGSGVHVAVLDYGVDDSHKELKPIVESEANFIPCPALVKQYGKDFVKGMGLRDCSEDDKAGHGTWVAGRLGGAANGFASNGVAPGVKVASYKVLSAGFGGFTSWIVAGMLDACDHGADIVNLSLGGYDDPSNADDVQDYLTWVDAVSYCRSKGTVVIAAAGNEHVRVNRVNMTLGSRSLVGVGQVDSGAEGIATPLPTDTSLDRYDLRGMLETPAGVPGVIMVSATNNANAPTPSSVPAAVRPPASYAGRRDQLAYYSSYGSRVDIAAPGGARKYNIPLYDGGAGDFLYGGWGSFGPFPGSSDICSDPASSSAINAACFKKDGSGFGWLQGTSVASPNLAGVAALALAAHPELRDHPDALLTRLQATARTNMVNATGPNDPTNTAAGASGTPCPVGYCHLDYAHPIAFASAYGAGIVDAAAATTP